jgi:hypothetical protein
MTVPVPIHNAIPEIEIYSLRTETQASSATSAGVSLPDGLRVVEALVPRH